MKNKNAEIVVYLTIRIVLMVFLQSITYLLLMQKDAAFQLSGYYWAIHITIINLLLLSMMIYFKSHNQRYLDFFKKMNKKDSFYFLMILIPLIMTAMLPNIILSLILYQDPQIGTTFLLGEIPLFFMIINIVIFPLLQGLVELPFYFMFVMPKLKQRTANKLIYLGLPIFFLSVQHAFMPLRFDLIYMIYRSIMFFPFAVFIAILIDKNPRMISYLIILHILMNASLFIMYFI